MQYPPTGLSSGNYLKNAAATSGNYLAVPSNGSILWQHPIKYAVPQLLPILQYPPTGLSSGNEDQQMPPCTHQALAVPSNGSILWQRHRWNSSGHRFWTCSTLQRVYPLATLARYKEMPVGGPCSTLQRVYPLATTVVEVLRLVGDALAVPSNGSILWQLRHKKSPGTIAIPLAVPSNGSILWQRGLGPDEPPEKVPCSTLQRVYPLAT